MNAENRQPILIEEVLEGLAKLTSEDHDFLSVARNIQNLSYIKFSPTSGMIAGSLIDNYLKQQNIDFVEESLKDFNAAMVSYGDRRRIVFARNMGVIPRIALILDLFGHLALKHEIKDYIGSGIRKHPDHAFTYEFKQSSFHEKIRHHQPEVEKAHKQASLWASRFVHQYFIGSKDITNPFVQTAIPVLDFLHKHP